ncbi:hypothetical protein [Bacillus paramycoides]|uniref:hypothetical protein n=1 Tax=Bacillus paramycoides TaxID=2026194 RepID=UPI002E1A2247|nr:hypothetical protein [Bacillus paramycoides]
MQKPFYSQWWFWGIAALVIIAVVGGKNSVQKEEVKTASTEPKKEVKQEKKQEIPKPEVKKAEPMKIEKKNEESNAGNRSNPLAIGQSAILEDKIFDPATSNSYDAKVEVSIKEIIRGEQAWKLIQKENQFNKAPADNMEYVLVKVKTKVVDADTTDFAYHSNDIINTEYVSEDGKVYQMDTEHQPVIPTPLRSAVFKGAEAEGYSVQYIQKNDDFKFVYQTTGMQKIYFSSK